MKLYWVVFAFICMDYFTGVCKAAATKSFSSKVMRQGLWHKLALVAAVAVGWLVDYAQTVVDIGISAPVGGAVCVYIIGMELVSILENICEINPEFAPDQLLEMFGQAGRKSTKGDTNDD